MNSVATSAFGDTNELYYSIIFSISAAKEILG
jgi:hypothetical protein